MSYVYISCAALILFIISLILGKKKLILADFLLILWLLILGINIITFLILDFNKGGYPKSIFKRTLVEFTDASVFLHGPIFLFYTSALAQINFKLQKEFLFHLITFALSFIFLEYGALTGDGEGYKTRMCLSILKMISVFIYTAWVITRLKEHRSLVQNIYSNIEEKNLNWLNFLSWGILIVWFISLLSLVTGLITGISLSNSVGIIPNLAICLFVYQMGYFGVRQNSIFVQQAIEGFPEEVVESGSVRQDSTVAVEKYKKSGLNPEKVDKLFLTLSEYMETNQPFLSPELSLFDLAKLIGVLPNHLSQIINVKTNQNFFDYINSYRVTKVKEYILNGRLEEHNLFGLAIESGFNSKASFNRAFKKHIGLTPSEFKKMAK